MSDATKVFVGSINEDGSFSLLGRLTAFDGTGAASPLAYEGNLVKQADLSTVTIKLFNLDSDTPTTPEQTATLTISAVVFDTLQTTGIWTLLKTSGGVSLGGNFKYDVAASWVPTARTRYRIEVKFVSTGGTVYFGKWQAETQEILGS